MDMQSIRIHLLSWGLGTTGVACFNLGRKFIGIELDEKYYKIAVDRLDTVINKKHTINIFDME